MARVSQWNEQTVEPIVSSMLRPSRLVTAFPSSRNMDVLYMIESHFTINSDAVTSRYDGRVPPSPPPTTTRDEPPLGSEHSAHVDMNTRYRMFKTNRYKYSAFQA